MVNINILKEYINNHSELLSRLNSGDIAGLTSYMNTKQEELSCVRKLVPIKDIFKWAAKGPFSKISDAADNKELSHQVRSLCMAATKMLASLQEINFADQDFINLANGLAVLGVISSQERTDLFALQTVSPASPSESLFGDDVIVTMTDLDSCLQ